MTRKRAIIWCAVSSEEQAKGDKTSLPAQERDARQFAADNDLQIVDVLIVGGFSRRYYTYDEFVQAAALDEFYDPARMWEHWRRCDFDVLIARAGDRFGREQSLFSEFVNRTIDAGAQLYLLNEGWVDPSNRRMYAAMSGYGAAVQVDNLRRGQKETKIKSASRGLTTGSKVPYSHKWVRNEAGKLVRLELDESKRRLWDDLATVFLEGVSYRYIEKALYERYGHVNVNTGKPFAKYFFYLLLHNPYFWGHAGRSYRSVKTRNGQRSGEWAFDPAVPPPEGVHIFYNVNDPVYTGEQAQRVKAELHRRTTLIKGRLRPYRTHPFAGLLLCGHCGRSLIHGGKGSYRCESHRSTRLEPRCDRWHSISERKVRQWVHARLSEMIANDVPDLLARGDEQPDLTGRMDALHRELCDLRSQASILVVKQAQAGSALASIYDEQLRIIGERIETVTRNLTETEREQRSRDTSPALAAFHALPDDLGEFWALDGTAINQTLHALMGNRRLVVTDGEITHTDDAPVHHSRKPRKRTYFGKQGQAAVR